MLFGGRDVGEIVDIDKKLDCLLLVRNHRLIQIKQIEFVGFQLLHLFQGFSIFCSRSKVNWLNQYLEEYRILQ